MDCRIQTDFCRPQPNGSLQSPVMKRTFWIFLSGFVWFVAGVFLLYKGIHFIASAQLAEETATWLMMAALVVGFLKGRFVLSKTVKRVVDRIQSLPLPIRLWNAYAPSYWILIGSMVLLGMSFRFLPIPLQYRGMVDVAIGSALVNGAMLYFRAIYGTASPVLSPGSDRAVPKE